MCRTISLLLAALLLAACGAGRPETLTRSQTVDGLTIAVEQPQQVVALQDYDLIVTLTDAQGNPVDGASVYLDLSMPGMTMGTNQPIADPLGDGRYRVRTVYSMEGDWLIAVHARTGGKEHVATFDLSVELPRS